MMISQILKFIDFTKTRKSKYEKKTLFFLQVKKFIKNTTGGNL